MNKLDNLRPEVREAVEYMDRGGVARIAAGGWRIIRAELLRLAEDAAMFAHAVSLGQRYKQRAEKAEAELADLKAKYEELDELSKNTVQCLREQDDEADRNATELAALKARIAEAPEYRCEADIISGRDGDYISAVLIHDDNAFQYPDVDGKRVRLLVEE